MNIKELIKKGRKDTKDSTLRVYEMNLKKLNHDKEITSLKFLEDTKHIFEKLKDKKNNTQRNYLSAVLTVLSVTDKKELYNKYRKRFDELTIEIKKHNTSNTKNEKQEKNWATIDELKTVMNAYRKYLRNKKILDGKAAYPLSKDDFTILQYYLICALYLLQPPRRLNYNMKIIRDKKENVDKDTNYLLIKSRNNKKFIFNKFKTKKDEQPSIIDDVPSEINKIINVVLKYNKTDNLILDSRDKPINQSQLGKMITLAFKPSGKVISVSLLRSIYISENINLDAIKKAKQMAKDMMHTTNVQQSVYLKED